MAQTKPRERALSIDQRVLSGYEHYRLEVSDLPPPTVRSPRGLPVDLSPHLAAESSSDSNAHSWITPIEIFAYDWHPLLALSPFLADFLDRVAGLEPPEDHRIVSWLEW